MTAGAVITWICLAVCAAVTVGALGVRLAHLARARQQRADFFPPAVVDSAVYAHCRRCDGYRRHRHIGEGGQLTCADCGAARSWDRGEAR